MGQKNASTLSTKSTYVNANNLFVCWEIGKDHMDVLKVITFDVISLTPPDFVRTILFGVVCEDREECASLKGANSRREATADASVHDA